MLYFYIIIIIDLNITGVNIKTSFPDAPGPAAHYIFMTKEAKEVHHAMPAAFALQGFPGTRKSSYLKYET